jgi:tripartite-type tricarboxylate transporter receptor subunit TctC
MIRLAFASGALAALALTAAALPAAAEWPEREVTYITNFDPGGESDTTARMQEPFFEKVTGQRFVYDYRVGGGGAAGWSQLNGLSDDGYTLMGVNTPHIFLQPQGGDVGYQTSDINVVYMFQITPYALVVPAGSPLESLEDFLAQAEAAPGSITVGGTGTNSAPHVAQASFDAATGITTTYVPFSGTAAVSAALLGNQVQAQWGFTTVGVQQGDQVRLLGVAMEERHPLFPDVPTFREKGIEFLGGARRGIAVPAGVPEDLRNRISDVFAAVNQDPELRATMEAAGYVLLDVPYSEMADYTAELQASYTEVARMLGMIN